MFAPVGYVPAQCVFYSLRDLGNTEISFIRSISVAKSRDSVNSPGKLHGPAFSQLFMSRLAFPCWAIWRIFAHQPIPVYLACSDGRLVRASPDFFFGNDELEFSEFSPLDPGQGLPELWEIMKARNIAGEPEEVFDSGWFVSTETWCVRSLQASIKKITKSHVRVSDVEELAKAATSFESWSVCFDAQDLPNDSDGLLTFAEELGADIRIREPSELRPPALRDAAGKAFVELFPNGRQGNPWKEVARQIANHINREVSVKTLTRAVNERTESWTQNKTT